MRLLFGLLLVSCLFTFPVLTMGQPAPETIDTGKRNPPVLLEGMVISATRWETDAMRTATRIESVSREEILRQNPQTSADMLGQSGTVFIQKSQQGGGSPMIRGFSANRLLMVVDGVRMNNAIMRGGNVHQIISVDALSLENTEVLFGPGSVQYGSDAIGGVINFETLKPEYAADTQRSKISVAALLRGASANRENSVHLAAKYGFKRWAFATSFSYNNFRHMRMGSHGPDEWLSRDYVENGVIKKNENPLRQIPSGYVQNSLLQKVAFRPNQNWEFVYTFQFSETGEIPRYDRLAQRDTAGKPLFANWYYGPQKWMMNHLQTSFKKRTAISDEIRLHLAYQNFAESRTTLRFGSTNAAMRNEEVAAPSANLDFKKNLNDKAVMTYGLEYVYNKVISKGINSRGAAISPRYPNSDWTSLAAYAALNYKLNSFWNFSAGMRYNQFSINSDFDTQFYTVPVEDARLQFAAPSANIGATRIAGEHWKFSALLSSGFRAPNVDDMGKIFDSERGSVVVPNPTLEPEYIYNAEVSADYFFKKQSRVFATVFYSYLDNAMARRNYTLNGLDSLNYDGVMSRVQAIQNLAFAQLWGLQAGADAELGRNFRLLFNANYQQGNEQGDDGNLYPMRHAAPLFGRIHILYKVRGLLLEGFSQFQAEVPYERLSIESRGNPDLFALDAEGNPYSPQWATLNFRAAYVFYKIATLTISFENLTDVRYRTYTSGISAPGRQVVISILGRL